MLVAFGIDRTVACSSEWSPSENNFSSVFVGDDNACGVHTDGTITCWVSRGHINPDLQGAFKSVSVGEKHSCAVRKDGTVACWGEDDHGQASPPEERFSSVFRGALTTPAGFASMAPSAAGEWSAMPNPRIVAGRPHPPLSVVSTDPRLRAFSHPFPWGYEQICGRSTGWHHCVLQGTTLRGPRRFRICRRVIWRCWRLLVWRTARRAGSVLGGDCGLNARCQVGCTTEPALRM